MLCKMRDEAVFPHALLGSVLLGSLPFLLCTAHLRQRTIALRFFKSPLLHPQFPLLRTSVSKLTEANMFMTQEVGYQGSCMTIEVNIHLLKQYWQREQKAIPDSHLPRRYLLSNQQKTMPRSPKVDILKLFHKQFAVFETCHCCNTASINRRWSHNTTMA